MLNAGPNVAEAESVAGVKSLCMICHWGAQKNQTWIIDQHAKRTRTTIDQPCAKPNATAVDRTVHDSRANTKIVQDNGGTTESLTQKMFALL